MTRIARTFTIVLCLATLIMAPISNITAQGTTVAAQSRTQAPPEGFADSAIKAVWQHDDGVVASGASSRPWVWGPGPFHTGYEPDTDAPGGSHLVQYFDKGRLELNDPNAAANWQWYVTSGRLVYELVSGQAQTGGGHTYNLGSASVTVAGDTGNTTAPTYATFANRLAHVQDSTGAPVSATLDAWGKSAVLQATPASVQYAHYEGATGHNWASVFWSFANAANRPAQFNWLYTLGYPITEPYWTQAPVDGKMQTILVQLFERRTLTYNPSNPTATQVEMGNVGRHYYEWRYADLHTAGLDTQYNVQIAVGTAPLRTTDMQEQVDFVNGTGQPLTDVVLHAPWNNWKGVFTLQSASVEGQAAQTTWREGINLDVQLPKVLPPGRRTTLSLQFELHPRPVGGRTGYDKSNDILSLGDMLPTVVPWQNGGWAIYPYSDLGDLGYYLSSTYRVQVGSKAGERLVVGGTGDLASYDAKTSTWVYTAANVRDVAYVVSPRFTDPRSDSGLQRKVGNITVIAYFLPGHRAQAQRHLDLVAPVIQWMNQAVGSYPFDTYMIAEMGVPLEITDDYAQEYPMDYFIPTNWLGYATSPGTWEWYTPMHECIHQWFYSAVGNNQLTDPWLDEAMTTYMTTEYIRYNFGSYYSQSYASNTAGAGTGRPSSSGVFSGFTSENQYTYTVYDTAVVMLNKVRQTMGDNAFYDAVRDYYATYRFKQATPANLLATLQKHTATDLQPIFAAYLLY